MASYKIEHIQDFPLCIKDLNELIPFELYAKGNTSLMNQGNRIAIIGARDATAEECDIAYRLGAFYSSQIVVSGLAKGIDTFAHRGCVDAKGKSIAVVATGLDLVYPKENQDLEESILENGGLILSEQSAGTKATPRRLVARTRLQMALADKVIVVACEKESGTMHAVDYAIKLGKPIFAIDNMRSGNRYLIEEALAISLKM